MRLRSLLLAATALSGLGHAALAEMSFAPLPFAADDAAKRLAVSTASATVDGTQVPLAYHPFLRTGDALGGQVFGQLMTKDGQPIAGAVSSAPDFTSLLVRGQKLYSFTHFEEMPAAIYLTELAVGADGNLTAQSTKPVDLSAVGGVWDPCAGSVTPWGTHLGSEEYAADARALAALTDIKDLDEEAAPMARYWGLDPATMTVDQFKAVFNPYRYGWAVEYDVAEDGTASVAKRLAMGRVSMEMPNVMPDRKTVYISADGTNLDLFRFVADTEGDLSAGQLYALKWVQTSADNGGAADVQWIDLGHSDAATVQAALDKGVTFADLFDVAEFNADGTCPEGFSASNAGGRLECLKVKPGMEVLASRLETERYASMLGATTEFRKMEGQAYDPATNRLYVAITDVAKGMTDADEKADLKGRNDIRLPKNPCGAVYELQLGADYAATGMKALLTGMPKDYAADAPEAGNTCDVDGIASPDNLTFIPGQNLLLIAEDTDHHQNDVAWAYDLAKGGLTRIFSTPYGSEVTSLDWYPDVMGHAYLMAVVQHPYGESDEDKATSPDDTRAYVGYIGPFPAMK